MTLDGVWPTDKTSRCLIKSPERLVEMNYEGRLEAVSRKQGAQFKEYRPETGSWVFKVTPACCKEMTHPTLLVHCLRRVSKLMPKGLLGFCSFCRFWNPPVCSSVYPTCKVWQLEKFRPSVSRFIDLALPFPCKYQRLVSPLLKSLFVCGFLFSVQVSHFSKYGLQDSDDDEEEHASKAEAKKLKTAQGLPPGQSALQHVALSGKPAPLAKVGKIKMSGHEL